MRDAANRCKNWTGTVHYADAHGSPACSPVRTALTWFDPSVASVTCGRCIATFGADEPGHTDPAPSPHANEHVASRAAERTARRAAREPAALDLDNGATRMAREVQAAFGADNG